MKMLILDCGTYLIRRGSSVGDTQNRNFEEWMLEMFFGDTNHFRDLLTDNLGSRTCICGVLDLQSHASLVISCKSHSLMQVWKSHESPPSRLKVLGVG